MTSLGGFLQSCLLLNPNDSQCNCNSQGTGTYRDKVRSSVARQTLGTVATSIGFDDGVSIKYPAVEKIEDIAADDWGERHLFREENVSMPRLIVVRPLSRVKGLTYPQF